MHDCKGKIVASEVFHKSLYAVWVVGVAYIMYLLLIFFIQRSLIYPGAKLPAPETPAGIARLSEPVPLNLPGGLVSARYLPLANDGRRHPVVIVCHGNREQATDLSPRFEALHRMGLAVLLVEYPGYSGMPGSATEQSTIAAAVAAYDALIRRSDVDSARIVAFGRSLGGGVACGLSRLRPVRALILQSAFTSLRPFSARYLVPGFLARDVYDNRQALQSYAGPTLILHGRRDRVVPFSHGEQLASSARNARLIPFDAGHSDILDLPGFWDAIGQFLHQEQITTIPVTVAGN